MPKRKRRNVDNEVTLVDQDGVAITDDSSDDTIDDDASTLINAAHQKSQRIILKQMNRKIQQTFGDGNCFVNSIGAQLFNPHRRRSTRLGHDMRMKIGEASQQFLPQMQKFKSVWQRPAIYGNRSKDLIQSVEFILNRKLRARR